jgi:hypothetical protein
LTHEALALHNVNALLVHAQSFNAHVAEQVTLPPATGGEHACAADVGEHTPSPAQFVYGPVHVPIVVSHVCECVPQFPQASTGAEPLHCTAEHLPAEQVAPAGHGLSHLPQLFASVCVSTQPALHMLCVPGHAHAPHVHLSEQVSLAPGTAGVHAVVVCGAHTPGVGHAVNGPVHVPTVMSHVRE